MSAGSRTSTRSGVLKISLGGDLPRWGSPPAGHAGRGRASPALLPWAGSHSGTVASPGPCLRHCWRSQQPILDVKRAVNDE
jgi:hypothetical protein